ncbi:SDR family NAD(P)-dependent oxidoreductase [Psychroflexus salis]|uniref:UDP-glucose 4-epimerase n=1 Tax=Psychroflexus salis TaxID=1526574 RepID=A0A916ZYH3_9FLAO|nr:SDR family NAD(P)-dependent oxidoreductase [Psychroflexus salis]GGE18498.1 hypothetical protein GCM10010831_19580 [Psychroflexus salis]
MKAKVIVTGGSGYIGSHTAIELINAGFKVLIIDDLSNSSKETLNRIEQITERMPDFIELNLANKKDRFQVIKKQKRTHITDNDKAQILLFKVKKIISYSILLTNML